MQSCPCNSTVLYKTCCQKFIEDEHLPETAEQLMRSRFTAFALKIPKYLWKTAHPKLGFTEKNVAEAMVGTIWKQLKIESTEKGQALDHEGKVEFKAHYETEDGKKGVLHELSSFVKVEGQWLYESGKIYPTQPTHKAQTGRNDPCPCGSGKKYKKCCGK